MKTKIIAALLLLISIALPAKKITVVVTNPNDVAVQNAPVVLKLDKYRQFTPDKRKKLAVFINNKQVSSQMDDMNGDSIADELVFLTDIPAKGKIKVAVKTISDMQRKVFPTEMYTDLIQKNPYGTKKLVKEV